MGEADTDGAAVSMVYNSVVAMPTFPVLSLAKYFSVVVVGIEIAAVYTVLDWVGAEPSVV